jgi:hypothetical protein
VAADDLVRQAVSFKELEIKGFGSIHHACFPPSSKIAQASYYFDIPTPYSFAEPINRPLMKYFCRKG